MRICSPRPCPWFCGLALALAVLASMPAQGRQLVIGRAVSANAMDPGFLREAATLVDNVFDTLVMRDSRMKLVPGLATSWKTIDDQTWEFTLRHNVTFQDGEPFDARAVAFTINRILNPAAKSPDVSYINTVGSVEAVAPYIVRIRTKGPDPLLLARLSRYPTYIVPPQYILKNGAALFARKPIGTGPYRVTEFVPDDHVTMQANDSYWRGKPDIETAIWRAIPDATARIAALLNGEVQLIETVPPGLAPTITADPKLRLVRVRHGGLVIYLGLKTAEKPLDDVRVRRALSLAIDRKAIVAQILKGYATLTGTQAGPFDFGYKPEPIPPFDPSKAKALLAEAGYPSGFAIRMQVPARYLNSADVGQVIAQEFGTIGVKAKLEVPDWSVYTQEVPAGKQAPIYMLGWGSTQTLDADAALYPIFRSGQPYSTVHIPELDQLLDQSRRTMDPKRRDAIFGQIQDLAVKDVPVLTLYQEDSLYAEQKSVGFSGRPDARIPLFDIHLTH